MEYGANMKKIYEKLVRDRIPEIIESTGSTCKIGTLDDGEYIRALDEKLREELDEYLTDGSIEELADLLEVVRASAIARGYTLDELEAVRSHKAQERGGFEKRIWLFEVDNR